MLMWGDISAYKLEGSLVAVWLFQSHRLYCLYLCQLLMMSYKFYSGSTTFQTSEASHWLITSDWLWIRACASDSFQCWWWVAFHACKSFLSFASNSWWWIISSSPGFSSVDIEIFEKSRNVFTCSTRSLSEVPKHHETSICGYKFLIFLLSSFPFVLSTCVSVSNPGLEILFFQARWKFTFIWVCNIKRSRKIETRSTSFLSSFHACLLFMWSL